MRDSSFRRNRIEVNDRENKNADDHDDQQKAGSASRMQGRIFLRVVDVQVFAGFEVVNGLVFGAVILENAVHVLHPAKLL